VKVDDLDELFERVSRRREASSATAHATFDVKVRIGQVVAWQVVFELG
jgi:hypothetical protein